MRQFRKRELEEIIKKHFPSSDIVYYYTHDEWKILRPRSYVGRPRVIHRIPLPENWQNITEEEFDTLIVLSML